MAGVDITGKIIAPDVNGASGEFGGYTLEEVEFYGKLRDGPYFGFSGGSLNWEYREYIQYREIHLPLASDRKNVDQILTVTYRIPD